ncbi:MAG: PD40 domain-containing protein, partial [Xanthomonadales bacterium]|nr:PD40 domain-containing protein [Xanthomonadales bacterium]
PTGNLPNPILFVTQVPVPVDFATIGSTFANHLPGLQSAARGGDLWIRYPDGSRRNLTAEAGFGSSGQQGSNAIAVRDPAVHWNGQKAVFAMVVGAPTQQFQVLTYRWQLYEVTGFGAGQNVQITLVPNQPAFNNVAPIYLSDGSIAFTSDRPRNGAAHLHPQQDEYESTPTVSGLWRLNPTTGALKLLDHAPSGDFDPMVDSFGRLLFTRWDHLQTDQQAEAAGNPFGNFDWASEAANAPILGSMTEVFPEPRIAQAGSNVNGHRFNLFLPWQIQQDGTRPEVLNHLGRHETQFYFDRSFNDDPNLIEFIDAVSGRTNPNSVENLFQLSEDPQMPGRYLAIDAPEFTTHAAGQLLRFVAAPTTNPDDVVIEYLTPESTAGTTPGPDHTGHYRNPIVLSDGSIVVAHADEQGALANLGSGTAPVPNYRFRLRLLGPDGAFMAPQSNLTPGLSKSVTYWNPDQLVSYSGELWELSPVEVRVRAVPPATTEPALEAVDQGVFDTAQVDPAALRSYLQQQNLALLVVRNQTSRDDADRQQPFNLRVPGGVQAIGASGTIYDISHFQMVQGDQVRGIGGSSNPRPGRRVLARFLHDAAAVAANPPHPTGPEGSAAIFPDGSSALFVPAQRALSWQTTDPGGDPVVRERFWLTFQPGEIRVCDGCHGINRLGQAGQAPAAQAPQALLALLQHWSQGQGGGDGLFADSFEN